MATSESHGPTGEPIARDPGHYWPSEHARIRQHDRGIPWPAIAATLRAGEVRNTDKPDLCLFVADTDADSRPVGVTASPTTGEIVTVTWRTSVDASTIPAVSTDDSPD